MMMYRIPLEHLHTLQDQLAELAKEPAEQSTEGVVALTFLVPALATPPSSGSSTFACPNCSAQLTVT